MSIAHVQDWAVTATGSVSSATSPASGSPVTGGNTIIVTVWYFGGGRIISTVTDSAGNSYTQDKSIKNGSLGCDVWSKSNATGGTGVTITVTPDANAIITFTAAEFSGLVTASPLDGTGSTNTGGGGVAPSTGTFSTTNANDLLIATFASTQINSNLALPSGFTRINAESSAGSFIDGDAAYQIVSATQTNINPTWGATSTGSTATVGLAYKAAAGAASAVGADAMMMMSQKIITVAVP